MAGHLNGQVDKAVGVQLQNLRICAGLAREEAAARLKVSHDVLNTIERGDLCLSSRLLLKATDVYEAPQSRIFTVAVGKTGVAPDESA